MKFFGSRSLLLALLASSPAWAERAVVIAPVADLRSVPSLPLPSESDDKQQTQLLFGETVEVVSSSGDWVQVNALDQPEFTTNQRWEGYPGWMLKSALDRVPAATPNAWVMSAWMPARNTADSRDLILPLGAQLYLPSGIGGGSWVAFDGVGKPLKRPPLRLMKEPPRDRRAEILRTAKLFIGTPYVWGGLSAADPYKKTLLCGIDCSGLVHVSYRVNGIQIPRDSMDQYMKADKIQRKDLRPADLVFLAPLNKPEQIVHVMLYAGGETLIEAPRTGLTVRQITFEEKTRVPFTLAESGQKLKDRVVYFGRFLKD